MPSPSAAGALVISLDFELAWGSRERASSERRRRQLLTSRSIVPRLATVFAERQVRATWAVVGMLFAGSRRELDDFRPAQRPSYRRHELDPYVEAVGDDEMADPLHLAGSLIDELRSVPGQEIGSHTFSHYYCLEEGQGPEQFRADLDAARAIAESHGVTLRSLVLPRNQWEPSYAPVVKAAGFDCYRGTQTGWAYRARSDEDQDPLIRGRRLLDAHIGLVPPPSTSWGDVVEPSGLCNVPASAFLRPGPVQRAAVELRRRRLTSGIRNAARAGRLFHLWWHPHNFATDPVGSFTLLERLLDEADGLRASHGFRTLSMGDVAEEALART